MEKETLKLKVTHEWYTECYEGIVTDGALIVQKLLLNRPEQEKFIKEAKEFKNE